MIVSACRTSLDVDPREFEKFFTSGERRGLFRRGRGEQVTAARDLLLSIPIGKQTEMTDPHEALGQDVEQEATDELEGIEVHHLLLIGVRGVAVAERDASVLDAQDAVVRDRDAMRVGAEIGEDSFGPCERRLCIDDPVALAKLLAQEGA